MCGNLLHSNGKQIQTILYLVGDKSDKVVDMKGKKTSQIKLLIRKAKTYKVHWASNQWNENPESSQFFAAPIKFFGNVYIYI